jgi:hypothetical protein
MEMKVLTFNFIIHLKLYALLKLLIALDLIDLKLACELA